MIEFALLAPMFFATLLAGLETAFDYYLRFELDQAAQWTMRQVRMGYAPTNWITYRNFFCSRLPSTMSCDRVVLDTRVVTDFYSVPWLVDQPTRAAPTSLGQSGDTVLLQAVYAAPVISPLWSTPTQYFPTDGKGGNWQLVRILGANAVGRHE